ncbi:hypothetical protein BC826DRAFT_988966 [Russula brevipes]|nr:hypothetical protein BC826DRAFT_988966 [Russula brevipes]
MGDISQTLSAAALDYRVIFDNALETYKRKTKQDIRSHPLFAKLEACNSPDAILTVLQNQIPTFDQSRSADVELTKWLKPTVNVLDALSATIGGGITLVYPPAGVIFTGIGILLSAALAVSASQDALAIVFERIGNFFRRLETYVEVPPTQGMTDVIVKIMVEVLTILAIATKEMKQSKARKYLRRLVGRADMEDTMNRLDQLTQDEVRMAAAQGLRATHRVDDKVQGVGDKVQDVDNKVQGVDDKVQGVDDRVRDVHDRLHVVIGGGEVMKEEIRQVADNICDQKRNQLREGLRTWLSPPDPSVNYNTASDAHTTLWFTESNAFKNWKSSGSLLWKSWWMVNYPG